MTPPASAGELLGLLRFGEVSAAAAFGRMLRGRTPAATQHLARALAPVARDEHKHERWLDEFCVAHGIIPVLPSRAVRCFFLSLASNELDVHLARIAALDGCVCQTLTQVVTSAPALGAEFSSLLTSIREDEAHHVAVTRRLALEMDTSEQRLAAIDRQTRWSFAGVLERYRPSFEAMTVDTDALLRRIRRHDAA